MPEVIVDKESRDVLKEFYATYKEELERESTERAKQAVIDSQQAELLAKEKVEQEKIEKILADTEKAELALKAKKEAENEQAVAEFRSDVKKSLDNVTGNNNDEKVLQSLESLNLKVDRAFELVEIGKPYVERADYVITVVAFCLLVVLPLFFIIRWLYWQLNIFR